MDAPRLPPLHIVSKFGKVPDDPGHAKHALLRLLISCENEVHTVHDNTNTLVVSTSLVYPCVAFRTYALIDRHIATANNAKVPLETIRSLKAAIETTDFLIDTVLRIWRHDSRRITPQGDIPVSFKNDAEWVYLRSTLYAIMVRKYVKYAKGENASTKLLLKVLLCTSIALDNKQFVPGSINTKTAFTLAQYGIWVDLIVAMTQYITDVGSKVPDDTSILNFYNWGTDRIRIIKSTSEHVEMGPANTSLILLKKLMASVLGISPSTSDTQPQTTTPSVVGIVPCPIPVKSTTHGELVLALIQRGLRH
jgi:hypothetical protein